MPWLKLDNTRMRLESNNFIFSIDIPVDISNVTKLKTGQNTKKF